MNGARHVACAVLTMGLATSMLGLLSYCEKQKLQKHKNVITGIGTIGHNKILLLDDIETNKERIYAFSKANDVKFYDYLKLDDTVTIITADKLYKHNIILKDSDAVISYNVDSIYARRQRQNYNLFKNNKRK